MRLCWNAARFAAGLVVMLAATPAHAAGEGAIILVQITIGSMLVGGVSAALAWMAARTGSRVLLLLTGVVGAIPVVLAGWGAVSLAAAAGVSGLVMAMPLAAVATVDVWAFVVACRRVKQRLAQAVEADAWFAERERRSAARRGQSPVP